LDSKKTEKPKDTKKEKKKIDPGTRRKKKPLARHRHLQGSNRQQTQRKRALSTRMTEIERRKGGKGSDGLKERKEIESQSKEAYSKNKNRSAKSRKTGA